MSRYGVESCIDTFTDTFPVITDTVPAKRPCAILELNRPQLGPYPVDTFIGNLAPIAAE